MDSTADACVIWRIQSAVSKPVLVRPRSGGFLTDRKTNMTTPMGRLLPQARKALLNKITREMNIPSIARKSRNIDLLTAYP